MTCLRHLLFSAAMVVCLLSTSFAEEPKAEIVSVKKIWDAAPHNAFTDLIWHNGHWFCVFREGQGHVSPDGALRILTSADGENWTSSAVITSPVADLRDAKIEVTKDGQLQLSGAGAWHDPQEKGTTHQSFVWYSKDGKDWGEAIPVADPGYWVWRIIPRDGADYGIGYATRKTGHGVRLYKSENGRDFKAIVPSLAADDAGYVNEAGMMFLPDGTMLSVLRRDNRNDNTDALLGSAQAPYTEWTWRPLGVRIGGPEMLQIPDGRIIVSGRDYVGGAKTNLWLLDVKHATLKEIATLPSKGDNSYPGLVYKDGLLWISYYSSHEGKSNIYLAKVKLPATTR